jgi:8-oxo-dGTP pyrophosphatase MutT (NUDIX family)
MIPRLPPGWRVHDVSPDVRFGIGRLMPTLTPDLEAEIARLWATAQERTNGQLFNGRVFSADAIGFHHVGGHWTEFRRIVAQMQRPHLFHSLGLRPLAVNGIVLGPQGIVFGRRPAGAIYQAGQWQLAPAGSVDDGSAAPDGAVDIMRALLAELREEIGLTAPQVRASHPLAIVEHAASHVLDVGVPLYTALTAKEISSAHRRAGNGEYRSLEVIAAADVADFVTTAGERLTSQALVFLTRLGVLAEQQT